VKRGGEAIEAGKKAMDAKDYEKAAAQFKLAGDLSSPGAPNSRELHTAAIDGLEKANAKLSEARGESKPDDKPVEVAKLEQLKQQVARRIPKKNLRRRNPPSPRRQPQPRSRRKRMRSPRSRSMSRMWLSSCGGEFGKRADARAGDGAERGVHQYVRLSRSRAGRGMPLAFAAERARYPFAQNRDLLRFSVKDRRRGPSAGRALNIVLLIDNSGSMERADRVRILREALRVLATQLQAQDKLSIITFARTPRLWADGVPATRRAKSPRASARSLRKAARTSPPRWTSATEPR
jgi:Mg-chelatase subunit ChlD